jgi:ParB family chromosome partitioning protein
VFNSIDKEYLMKTIPGELAYVPIDRIKLHPKLKYRDHPGGLESLMQSMGGPNGQLQPVLIDTSSYLIFGFRRLEAAKRLGWPELLCRIIDLDDPLTAIRDENVERLDHTVSEKTALAKLIEEYEREKAIARQRSGLPSSNSDKGRTDAKAAKEVGWSKDTYRDAKVLDEHGTDRLKRASMPGTSLSWTRRRLPARQRRFRTGPSRRC